MSIYERHTPEKTVLYQSLARSWPGIVRDYNAFDEKIPKHVLSEFDRYFRCGILQHGFVRLKCSKCELERVTAYSCKTRGVCFSCNARRMDQTAERIEEEVWPQVNARQWVLSFPFQVRHWLSKDTELLKAVNLNVCKEITSFYEQNVSSQINDSFHYYSQKEVATGAISFVQFFNSALNLTPHLHIIFMDGGWVKGKSGFEFVPVKGFRSESMIDVIHGIISRLTQVFKDFGYVTKEGDVSPEEPELSEDVPLPFKPRAPKAYRKRGSSALATGYQAPDPNVLTIKDWCNLHFKYFSLHAGVAIKGTDRFALKKLIRYTSRSAVSPSRLSYVDPQNPEESSVKLTLKKAWRDGTSELVFTQDAFAEKMATLVPPTWFNLTRYFGLFAPGHAWRDFIVPGNKRKKKHQCEIDLQMPATKSKSSSCRAPGEYWIPWAELMSKTFGIDPLVCECGSKMVVQECVTDGSGIAAMMVKMGLSATPPPLGRQRVVGELDYVFEE